MVLVSDKKYACETCIKGHRSSACKHTDRPLFEIKKKGRPVTQCEHCRELRKTKQVHVKCSCGAQDQAPTTLPSHTKKAPPKLPATAAFPNGLPDTLEPLATLPQSSDDSDHSGDTSPTACTCSSSGQCNCWVPRKPPTTRRRYSAAEPPKRDKHHPDFSKHQHQPISPPLSSHVLARIAELRPVLPKPSHKQLPLDGSLHDPSSSIPHSHSIRHHVHDFSPYGRAYGYTHSDHQQGISMTPDSRSFAGRPVLSPQPTLASQPVSDTWPSAGAFPSVCACGDSCMCPGCTLHNNPSITDGATFASCTNPSSCAFCLDCTILSMPEGIPPPNIDLSSEPTQSQEFDEWLRQVSMSALSSGAPNMQPNFNPYELSMPQPQPYQTSRPRMPQSPSLSVECCSGQCKCPPNSCTCLPDCCGCCQGCKCDRPCSNGRPQTQTTFAVSGERGSCCGKADSNTNPPSAGRRLPDFMAMTSVRDQSPASVMGARSSQGYYGQQGAYVDYSETPSRSSSSSSLSSRNPTRPPTAPGSRVLGQGGSTSGSRSPPQLQTGPARGFTTYAESERVRGAAPYSNYNPSLDAMRFE